MSTKITVFDSEKAVAVILYLAAALPEPRNLYKVLKAIYRANKAHLHHYGRQIFNETYSAMKYGTVPSYAYDITANHVRDGKWRAKIPKSVRKQITVSADDTITPLAKPDMNVLSETDVECLNEAISYFRGKDFDWVKSNAHEDAAYNGMPLNATIPLERVIVKTLPDGEALLEYLKTA